MPTPKPGRRSTSHNVPSRADAWGAIRGSAKNWNTSVTTPSAAAARKVLRQPASSPR